MRYAAAVAGIVVSILPLIFFWVGAQTFIQPLERMLAVGMVILTGALLLLSASLLFTPVGQRIQAVVLALTLVAVATIAVAYQAGLLSK